MKVGRPIARARWQSGGTRSQGPSSAPNVGPIAFVACGLAAPAEGAIARLDRGFEPQPGPTCWRTREASFGRRQKLAFARGFMRERPLVLALDEPAAALGHARFELFERYAATMRTNDATILVSHRFSTVRMADPIVVLDGARAMEAGSHDDLKARGGHDAQLYGIQAAANHVSRSLTSRFF